VEGREEAANQTVEHQAQGPILEEDQRAEDPSLAEDQEAEERTALCWLGSLGSLVKHQGS
jgi:hypothetical protein